jgi:hypothetical protein
MTAGRQDDAAAEHRDLITIVSLPASGLDLTLDTSLRSGDVIATTRDPHGEEPAVARKGEGATTWAKRAEVD